MTPAGRTSRGRSIPADGVCRPGRGPILALVALVALGLVAAPHRTSADDPPPPASLATSAETDARPALAVDALALATRAWQAADHAEGARAAAIRHDALLKGARAADPGGTWGRRGDGGRESERPQSGH